MKKLFEVKSTFQVLYYLFGSFQHFYYFEKLDQSAQDLS